MNKIFIRTDKNGTKIYHDYTCPKCGGRGGSDSWAYTGWTCFKCGGRGKTEKPTVIKVYTDEYRAKLDEAARRRAEKKVMARKAAQPEWMAERGFVDGCIHVVTIPNSYEKREEIKAAGGRYNQFAGWYFSNAMEEYRTVPMTKDECLIEYQCGDLDWDVGIKERAMEKVPKCGGYVGAVGDKLDISVTKTDSKAISTYYGVMYVHVFADENGNMIVWKTATECDFPDNAFRLKGTVKEQSEFRGQRQTVLTRCKVV